jgi:hypothetical protein
MLAAALTQTGEATHFADGRIQRPVQSTGLWSQPPKEGEEAPDFIAVAVLDDEFADYSGYTGPVAQNISKKAGKPAVVFAPRGVDEHGQRLYKFSSRNDAGVNMSLGGLIEDEAMRAATTLKKRDESGAIIEEPSLGGHAEVVSGACTAEKLPDVVAAMQTYARRRYQKTRSFWPSPWDGPEAVLAARKIGGERLPALEEQSSWLAPFSNQKQALYSSARGSLVERKAKNAELRVSVEGVVRDLAPQPQNAAWLEGVLDLGGGITRKVCYPADIEAPPERVCEFVLRLGKPAPYYLRLFHDPEA